MGVTLCAPTHTMVRTPENRVFSAHPSRRSDSAFYFSILFFASTLHIHSVRLFSFVCVCACVPLVVLLCLPVQLQMSPLHLDEKCVAAASRARVPGECTLSRRS